MKKILWMGLTLGMSMTCARAITPAEEPVVIAVQKALPAVVNINTEAIVQHQVQDPFDLFFNRYYMAKQKVRSLGSGVLVSPDGYIITNAHVVERGEKSKIQITLFNQSIYQAQLVGSDLDADLALLKIDDKKPFPFIELRNLSPNLQGETVIAIGDPIGYQSSVSVGILSAKDRTVQTEEGTYEGLLQTDAAINPGNSGGALVDINGNFVGLNTAKAGGGPIEGLGFAIPGEKVAAWMVDAVAIAKGEKKAPTPVSLPAVLRQRFGLVLQEMTPELQDTFGFQAAYGMLISDVDEGSPADKAEIKRGMLLVAIGDTQIQNEASLPRKIVRIKAGDQVPFTIAFVKQNGNFIMQRSQQVMLIAR